ncbi:hypothetical protein [Streptomyces sp. NBC_00344]|uniref:hypothetical protein n=1 Tax=Streptomyces sp. NBC_00344 TaxID=2975720 RepID=UPI002E1E9071
MNPRRTSLNAQRTTSIVLLLLVPLVVFAGSSSVRAAMDFIAGVLSLVSLTAAVVWGLIATDRLLLSSRMRLVAQGVHRTAAVSSIFFLLLHITVKVALGHVALLGALVPFGLGFSGRAGLIGFGSLAAYLLITAGATGALRSAFATPGRIAGRWRALHMLAYPAWCTGLLHGLYAGRAPATYVVVLYSLSLVMVVGVLSLRMLPRPVKRRIAARITELAAAGSGAGAVAAPADPVPPAPRQPAPQPYAQQPLYEEPQPPAWPRAYEPSIPYAPAPPQFQEAVATPARPLYDPPPRAGISGPRWPAPAPPPPAQAPAYDSPHSAGYPTEFDTEPLPEPFQPPSAGEPWHTPAGDRK